LTDFFAKSCVNGIYPHYNLIAVTRALSLQSIPKKHTIFFAPVNFIFPSYSDRKRKKKVYLYARVQTATMSLGLLAS